MIEKCPLCKRDLIHPSDHHLKPKCRGGKKDEENMVLICADCHSAIHGLFSNKELEREYNSVDALLSDDKLCKAIKFISKQDPNRRLRTKRAKSQKYRGRNG